MSQYKESGAVSADDYFTNTEMDDGPSNFSSSPNYRMVDSLGGLQSKKEMVTRTCNVKKVPGKDQCVNVCDYSS